MDEVVEPFVPEANLDLAVPDLLEGVMDLIRRPWTPRVVLDLLLRAQRHAARGETLEDELTCIRLRHLEDVEVGIELETHRAESRDRGDRGGRSG